MIAYNPNAMHPLDWLVEPLVPEVLDAVGENDPDPHPTPLPQKTTNGTNGLHEEGTTSALSYARRMAPRLVKRLVELGLTSPNHAAARSACRDGLQIAGLLTETTRVDVIVSFKAIFQRMTADELDRFLAVKEFPDRL